MSLSADARLARRRADVEAKIHQLAIDQNRKFSRSFFGSGAADMLRKLAAFKIAIGGGVTQGQLYSMNPAMRQDVGNLTGMNPDMSRLLRERNTLTANGFASGGYTGDGNPNEIAGVVHKGEYVVSKDDLKFRPPMPPGGAWGANPKADTSHYVRHGEVKPSSMADRLAQGLALPAAALMLYKASRLYRNPNRGSGMSARMLEGEHVPASVAAAKAYMQRMPDTAGDDAGDDGGRFI